MTTHIASTSALNVSWVKSSFSGGNNNCLECARIGSHTVAVRDSKEPDGPAFLFRAAAWTEFTRAVNAGVFDR